MKMKWIQKLRQIDIGISVIALVLLIAVTFAGVIFREEQKEEVAFD